MNIGMSGIALPRFQGQAPKAGAKKEYFVLLKNLDEMPNETDVMVQTRRSAQKSAPEYVKQQLDFHIQRYNLKNQIESFLAIPAMSGFRIKCSRLIYDILKKYPLVTSISEEAEKPKSTN